MANKKGLGKGLNALFGTDAFDAADSDDGLFDTEEKTSAKKAGKSKSAGAASDGETVVELKIIDIEPNRKQPRKIFDDEQLETLADSIKTHGIIQPVLVSPTGNGTYRIVAGERRWRASKLAGLKKIPCIIKEYDNRSISELALVENLQREDLSPLEEAEGYQNLIDEFGLTQEEVSSRVGKSRSAVANALRLNNLSKEVKELLAKGELSAGHARAILGLSDSKLQIQAAQTIIKEGLNVRQAEVLIKRLSSPKTEAKKEPEEKALARYYKDVEKVLTDKLGTKVRIVRGSKKSKIEIEYYTKDDFERLLNIL